MAENPYKIILKDNRKPKEEKKKKKMKNENQNQNKFVKE